MVITNNSVTRCGVALGNAAFPLRLPVTLTLAEPIVAVGTPFRVTELCAPDAIAAKPTEAGFARKTE